MSFNLNRKPALDDVLGEIASSPTPPDASTLRTWLTKYPEYKREIVDFATDWVEMEAVNNNAIVAAEDVDLVVNRTMSRVQAILDADRPSTIQDLLSDAKTVGHDVDSFRCALGIDESILTCLIGRLVEPATVPLRLVQGLAKALNRSLDIVREYLKMPPMRPVASRSLKRPQVQRKDFAMLVQHSSLSTVEKERWLAEAPDPQLRE